MAGLTPLTARNITLKSHQARFPETGSGMERNREAEYYFVPETGQMKLGWSTIDGKKYYFEKDGHQTIGWRSLGGKKYYFVPEDRSDETRLVHDRRQKILF